MAKMVCPVWLGYLLASPIRKLFQNPDKILAPYLKGGMTVMDIGCAMGFFSLPAARMVGPNGKVLCVDLQEGMFASLEKRAKKAGVYDQIQLHLCGQDSLGLGSFSEKIDFALASAMVHEVPDAARLFAEVYEAVRPDGRFLVAEPRGHVSMKEFEITISIARESGFTTIERPEVGRSHGALFQKGA